MKIETTIVTDEGVKLVVNKEGVDSLSEAADLFSTVLTGAWGYEVAATLSVEPDGPHFNRDGLLI